MCFTFFCLKTIPFKNIPVQYSNNWDGFKGFTLVLRIVLFFYYYYK